MKFMRYITKEKMLKINKKMLKNVIIKNKIFNFLSNFT